jgi:hypothetical protein
VAKLQKSLDPRKVWDEFQKELGRYLQSPPVSDPQTGEPILLASTQSVPTSSSIWENLKYIDKLFYTLFWNAQWTTGHKVSLFRAIDKLRQQSDPQLLDTFKSIAKVVFEKYFGVPFPTLGPLLDIFQSYDTMKIANDVHAFHKALINARKLYPDLSAEQLIKQLWDPELGLGLLDPAFSAYNKTDVATIVSLYIAVTGDKNLTGKF